MTREVLVVVSKLDDAVTLFPRRVFDSREDADRWIADHQLNEKWPQSRWMSVPEPPS